MDRIFTLYGLCKPGEEIRYIGITSGNLKKRLTNHLCSKANPHKDRWISKMRKTGIRPDIIPLCVGLSFEEACWIEREVIKELRNLGIRLTNISDGGAAPTLGRKFGKRSIYTCDKIRKALKGNRNGAGNLGKVRSEEQRLKISVAGKGISKPKSFEHRKALSLAHLGKKLSVEHREKLASAKRGVKRSEEAKEKVALGGKLRWERFRQEKILEEMWR